MACPKGQVIFVLGDGVLGFRMAYFWGEISSFQLKGGIPWL